MLGVIEKMEVGKCIVCGGKIVDDVGLWDFGSNFHCKDCGLSYKKITEKTANEDGKRMYLVEKL